MSFLVDERIDEYAERHSTPPEPLLAELESETSATMSEPQMLAGPVQGRFFELLVHASGAKRILEIGTFTGYSAMSMAEALPTDGRLISCEIDERHAEIAREHIAMSPHADKIEVRVGPALDTIASLDGEFDMVFIDADKVAYRSYYEAVLPLLSERGFICIDNVLWSLAVADPNDNEPSTVALRELNDFIVNDPRVECVMVPIRDGVSIARRR
jgi:caffeoyl-CoA O-methyltransferase